MNMVKQVRNALCILALSACAHMPNPSQDDAVDQDPWSGLNHLTYAFNTAFDKYLLKPITQGYRYVVPQTGRTMVTNFISNLYTPVIFANSVMQGDPQNSFASFWRFTLNTTLGMGGVIDFASEAGLKDRSADFGETLAMYGVPSGPYFVLPVIGPSNVRDATGRLADAFIDPFNYVGTDVSIGIWTTTAIDARSTHMQLFDDIYNNSLDPYSTFRSAYMQNRAEEIRRGEAARQKALDNTGVQ